MHFFFSQGQCATASEARQISKRCVFEMFSRKQRYVFEKTMLLMPVPSTPVPPCIIGLTSAATCTSTSLPTHIADSGGDDMFKALLAVSQREMNPDDGAADGGTIAIGLRTLEDSSPSRRTFREISVAAGRRRITVDMKIKLLLRTRNPKRWTLPLQGIFLRLVQVFPRDQPNELHIFRTGASMTVAETCCRSCSHTFFSFVYLLFSCPRIASVFRQLAIARPFIICPLSLQKNLLLETPCSSWCGSTRTFWTSKLDPQRDWHFKL